MSGFKLGFGVASVLFGPSARGRGEPSISIKKEHFSLRAGVPKNNVFNIQKSHFSLWARTNLVVPLLLVGLLKLLKPFGGSWRLLGAS